MSYVGYIITDYAGGSPRNDSLLFTNLRPEYAISSGTISYKLNTAAQASFTLPATNIMRNDITPLQTAIRIEEDGETVFVGAVIEKSVNYRGDITFTAEDYISLLNRVIDKPPKAAKTATQAIQYICDEYTAAGAPLLTVWPLRLDTVTVTGSVSLNPDEKYISLFDALKAVMELGGYITLDYHNNAVYMSHTPDIGVISTTQQIKQGQNIIDISSQIKPDSLISRVYPIGKDGLTIASVNDGKAYLVNTEVENVYGCIAKQVDFSDIETAAALKTAGQTYLNSYAALKSSIQISAVDLSTLDITIDSFTIGDYIRVVAPRQGVDTRLNISELTKDLVKPSNSKLSLGAESARLTTIIGGIK